MSFGLATRRVQPSQPFGLWLPPTKLVGPAHQTAGGVWLVENEYEVDRLLERLNSPSEFFGLDSETEGCNPHERSPAAGDGRIICLSFAFIDPSLGTHPLTGHSLAQRVFFKNWGEAEEKRWLYRFQPWLEDDRFWKVGANFYGYDRHIFNNHGIKVEGVVFDNVRASRFDNPSSWDHDLKTQGNALGYLMREYKTLFSVPILKKDGTPGARTRLESMSVVVTQEDKLNTLRDYASLDAKISLEAYPIVAAKLQARPWLKGKTMLDAYQEIEIPYAYVLNGCEQAGVDLDTTWCEEQSLIASYDASLCEKHLVEWVNAPMNFGSVQQKQHLLYNDSLAAPTKNSKLKIQGKGFPIPPVSKGKRKVVFVDGERVDMSRPTDNVAIQWLADHVSSKKDREGLRNLLQWSKIRDIKKYFTSLPTFVDTYGRVHPYLAPSTETGRLAASKPPLQQMPKPGKDPIADRYHVREAFTAPDGWTLIAGDFSQLEMRILAHFLIVLFNDYAFANDLSEADLHGATAIRVFGKDQIETESHGLITSWSQLNDIIVAGGDTDWINRLPACPRDTPVPMIKKFFTALRNAGKIVNFSINYGKTAHGLGNDIRDDEGNPIGKVAAQAILDAYFAAYPAIAKFGKWAVQYAQKYCYARTLLGRYRPIPDIRSENKRVSGHAERVAKNTPIQGSAADIAKLAQLKTNTYDIKILRDKGYYDEELARMEVRQILQVHDEIVFRCPAAHAVEAVPRIQRLMENCLDTPLKVPLPVEIGHGTTWRMAH